MGEYADDYFRKDVKRQFGFDPGSMYGDDKPKPKKTPKKQAPKVQCAICKKLVGGLSQHQFDVHGIQAPNV